jgi:membrane dipeptidase
MARQVGLDTRGPEPDDLAAHARALGISRAALELWRAAAPIDLHIDTFIWQRLFGYDLRRRHGTGPFAARLLGHADLPRCLAAGLGGAVWIITTNPLRSRAGKRQALFANLQRLSQTLANHPGVALVRSHGEYAAARARGLQGAFIGLQGGNALEYSLDDFDRPELGALTLITLLHMTRSRLGAPALPRLLTRGDQHLTRFGADYVRRLNQRRILVDLAHISRTGYWDALAAHDRSLPPIVSHTACDAVYPHFRNLDDQQLRALAERGGVAGVLVHTDYLGRSRRTTTVEHVVDHLAHIVKAVGPEHAALGSDYDGFIIPPRDQRSVLELPRLVDAMLRRGFRDEWVQQILSANFLRVLKQLRP